MWWLVNFISNDAEVLAVNCREQASIRWITAATAQVCSWYQPRVSYARSYKARKRLLRYIKKWIIYHLFCEEKNTNTPIHKSIRQKIKGAQNTTVFFSLYGRTRSSQYDLIASARHCFSRFSDLTTKLCNVSRWETRSTCSTGKKQERKTKSPTANWK